MKTIKPKAGMYVRFTNGVINRIKKVENNRVFLEKAMNLFCYDSYYKSLGYIQPDDFVSKLSFNLIDLIEVGDYVNGEKVLDINCKLEAPFEYDSLLDEDEHKGIITTRQTYYPSFEDCIESVVTKEQFKSMEYRKEEQK